MGFVTPGKRKLLNTSLTNTKSSKRSAQTISGLMNNSNNNPDSMPVDLTNTRRSSKKSDKVPNSYAKTHIKNNVAFMQKSTRLTQASSKFLSSKLRNNSTFLNTGNIENYNNNMNIHKSPSTKSSRAKKQPTSEQSMQINDSNPVQSPFSKENLAEQDAMYSKRLNEFRYQLEKLNKLDEANLILEQIDASLFADDQSSSLLFSCFSKFLEQIKSIKNESEENMSVVENYHEMQKNEASVTFNLECSRAVQEFQDKRRELKERLKGDNEDKRRQIEVERNALDINMDTADVKPKVTRKLRRRGNGDLNVDSSNPCMDGTGSTTTVASSLLQNTSSLAGGSLAVPQSNCTVSSTVSATSQFISSNISSNTSSYFASTSTSVLQSVSNPALSAVNDRKKAKLAAVTFTLSEDDINEDLKQLV